MTTRAFVDRTILYWTLQTGMGAAFCLTALLGLVVGAGTIGQTVFANTMEHLGEFATLKAMGASPGDLNTIILGAGRDRCCGGLRHRRATRAFEPGAAGENGRHAGDQPPSSRLGLFCVTLAIGARGGLFLDPQSAKARSRDDLQELA